MACRERKWRTKEANRASFDRSIALNPFSLSGLDLFGVKLPEAGKLLGKKFACGASVTKTAEAGKEQVEVQGDVVARAAELLVEQYGKGEGVPGFPLLTKGAVYSVVSKKKERVFPDA